MPKPLRIAVVGSGHMGKYHAQAIAERSDLGFVGVYDADAARAAEVAEGCGTRALGGLDEVAAKAEAVVIAAATSAHADVAVPLVERGLAILVEKPLAPTRREARRIADAAAKAGVVAQVGHILRFDPVTRAIDGRNLRPRYIEVTWVAPYKFRSADVGVVMDLMIHGLDVVLHLAGEMPERVDAAGGSVVGPHEDIANARLAFPGGAAATLTASRMSRTAERRMRIFTDTAYVHLDYAARTAEVVTARPGLAEAAAKGGLAPGAEMADLVTVESLPIESAPDALRAQLGAFVAAVRGERPVAVPLEDGVRAVEVARRIASAIQGPGKA